MSGEPTRGGWPGYGHQPSGFGQEPYGHDPFGQPHGYGSPYGQQPAGHSRRPVTVAVGAWTSIVMAVLWLMFAVFILVAALAGRDEFVEEIGSAPGAAVVLVVFVVMVLFGVLALWASIRTLQRSHTGRVVLTVVASLGVVVWLLSILSVVTVVPLLVSIVVIVLLYTGGANDWFARRAPGPDVSPYGGGPTPPYGRPPGW